VVLHGDGGGKGLGLKKPLEGAGAVARFGIALAQRMPADARMHEIELNGAPALALSSQGHAFVVIMVEVQNGRIHRIYAIANPDKLGRMEASLGLDNEAPRATL